MVKTGDLRGAIARVAIVVGVDECRQVRVFVGEARYDPDEQGESLAWGTTGGSGPPHARASSTSRRLELVPGGWMGIAERAHVVANIPLELKPVDDDAACEAIKAGNVDAEQPGKPGRRAVIQDRILRWRCTRRCGERSMAITENS